MGGAVWDATTMGDFANEFTRESTNLIGREMRLAAYAAYTIAEAGDAVAWIINEAFSAEDISHAAAVAAGCFSDSAHDSAVGMADRRTFYTRWWDRCRARLAVCDIGSKNME